jgi:hypothetical protein
MAQKRITKESEFVNDVKTYAPLAVVATVSLLPKFVFLAYSGFKPYALVGLGAIGAGVFISKIGSLINTDEKASSLKAEIKSLEDEIKAVRVKEELAGDQVVTNQNANQAKIRKLKAELALRVVGKDLFDVIPNLVGGISVMASIHLLSGSTALYGLPLSGVAKAAAIGLVFFADLMITQIISSQVFANKEEREKPAKDKVPSANTVLLQFGVFPGLAVKNMLVVSEIAWWHAFTAGALAYGINELYKQIIKEREVKEGLIKAVEESDNTARTYINNGVLTIVTKEELIARINQGKGLSKEQEGLAVFKDKDLAAGKGLNSKVFARVAIGGVNGLLYYVMFEHMDVIQKALFPGCPLSNLAIQFVVSAAISAFIEYMEEKVVEPVITYAVAPHTISGPSNSVSYLCDYLYRNVKGSSQPKGYGGVATDNWESAVSEGKGGGAALAIA